MISFLLPVKVLYADVQIPIVQTPKIDTRISALQAFLTKHKCADESTAFIAAADAYGLDYRVLPVIWVKESQCGLHQPAKGNGFGFGNGSVPYSTVSDAIWHITAILSGSVGEGSGRYYAKATTVEAKIKVYNSVNPQYWASFNSLFTSIQ